MQHSGRHPYKGEYEWNDNFGDIDGWDLQHIRRVDWKWSSLESPKTFPEYTLKLGDTTQSCDAPEVIAWVNEIINIENISAGKLPELPKSKQQ